MRQSASNRYQLRSAVIFCAMTALSMGLIIRIAALSQGSGIMPVSDGYGSCTIEVVSDRAYIYDCKFLPLVNRENRYFASIVPSPSNSYLLEEYYGSEALPSLISARKPVVIPVDSPDIYAGGVEVYQGKRRYSDGQPAVHVIGSLTDGMTTGASGIEKALDAYLSANGTRISARYSADALGRAFDSGTPETLTRNFGSRAGVVLTLDLRIQNIAETALNKLGQGAVVVMDVKNGDIKALASHPDYDPNHISDYTDAENSPFLNRAFAAYSVGSTFKLVTAAAALESGIPTTFEHSCPGWIDAGGVRFNCQKLSGHGELSMKDALAVSCNPYFIALAAETGAENIKSLAIRLGFGTADVFCDGLCTSSGNLPSDQTLSTPAGAANFAFGQGELLATPVQICKLVCTIANGGYSVTPRLIDGYTEDGRTLSEAAPIYAQNRVLSASTAATLRKYMVNVVKNGSGRRAAPESGGAGGKTASAQTGQFTDGVEKIEGWFAGFYPADEPRYAIVVLAEGAGSGATAAAPVFKEIADGIGE